MVALDFKVYMDHHQNDIFGVAPSTPETAVCDILYKYFNLTVLQAYLLDHLCLMSLEAKIGVVAVVHLSNGSLH